jgi:hypothetical protein
MRERLIPAVLGGECPALGELAWDPAVLSGSPFHASVANWVARLPPGRFPDVNDLNALRGSAGAPRSARGSAIRFVPPAARTSGAACYERRVFAQGEVATRPSSWHDLFNALVWLSFPRTKAALNQLHVMELRDRDGAGPRGRLRDQATLFDEGGMVVACADPHLEALLRDFEWRRLFLDHRAQTVESMRFYIFGHALLAKGLQPYKAMAARAFTVAVDRAFLDLTVPEQVAQLDDATARAVGQRALFARRESFTPVPVMGIPGWSGDNRSPGYYDDVTVFRPQVCPVPEQHTGSCCPEPKFD